MTLFKLMKYKTITLKVFCFLLFSVCLSCCGRATVNPQPISETVEEPEVENASGGQMEASPTRLVEVPPMEVTPGEPQQVDQPGLSLVTFASDNFVGSGNCAVCHSKLADEAGTDVSIPSHWRSVMHANSAKDPLWQAKVSSEVIRNPGLKAVIEDKCATCHTPMVRTEVSGKGESVLLLEEGILNPENPQSISAMDGVSCSLCHQIQNLHLGEKDSFSGGYSIDTAAVPPDRFIYGPFHDPSGQLMISTVGFTPVYGEQTLDSGHCGTCHNLYTPYVDSAGKVIGVFPEQMIYTEWENSVFGDGAEEDKSCQECHMPAAQGTVVISNMPKNLTPRSPFAQHYFVGGNAFVLNILEDHISELALTATKDYFDATIARTLNQLQNSTAELNILEAAIQEDSVKVVVNIVNKSGHKVPAGFLSRRAWIHLVLKDSGGHILFESGKTLPDGSIMGNDADTNILACEPHYDFISSPDQVQIYESIMQNTDGQITYTLLRGASYVKDNRLLPEGFNKEEVIEDIAVYGTAAEDQNFIGGSDQVQYIIDLNGATGPLTVTVELLFQTVSFSFMQDLGADSSKLVERFNNYYLEADKTPVVITTDEEVIE